MKVLINEKLSEHKYKTPEGYLICVDAVLARTGKQSYRKSEIFNTDDNTEIEVDRQPNEVFSEATLASFENKPITVEHPNEDVNSGNIKEYAVGFVRDVHKGYDNGQPVILGTLVIQDAETIEEIENGEHTDLSCGYDCDINDEENPQQRNIRGNHVALCQCGRAGNARIVDSKKLKDIRYKNYDIEYNVYGQKEYTVQYRGDDVWFKTEKEARDFIDEITSYKDSMKDDKSVKTSSGEIHAFISGNKYKVSVWNKNNLDYDDFRNISNKYGVEVYKSRIGNDYIDIISSDKDRIYKAFAEVNPRYPVGSWQILDSIKDISNVEYYKGFIFSDYDKNAPYFTGFNKEKEIQKIGNDYIVYVKNGMHGNIYSMINNYNDNEGFTMIIEPGKIEMTKLKRYSEYNTDLIKAAKQIENTNNIKFVDSVKEPNPTYRSVWLKVKEYVKYHYNFNYKKEFNDLMNYLNNQYAGSIDEDAVYRILRDLNEKGYIVFTKDSEEKENVIDTTEYRIVNYNGKWYYEMKQDDGFAKLVGPYMSEKEAREYFMKHRPNEKLLDSINDELYSLQELREMRVDNYKGTDIYKIYGQYSTNPNTSNRRFNTLEQVKEYIDNGFRDSIKDVSEKEIREYMKKTGFSYIDAKRALEEDNLDFVEIMRRSYYDEETPYKEVTENLEKNINDESDLSLLKEYFNERQPNKKMELRNKLKSMNYREGVSGVNSRELMWVELNGKRYEVKNLSSVKPLDSIKDSYIIQSKYNTENYLQEDNHFGMNKKFAQKFNSYEEAAKKANILYSDWDKHVNIIKDSKTSTKLSTIVKLAKAIKICKDSVETMSEWIKKINGVSVEAAILKHPKGYTFRSSIIREDRDFNSYDYAVEYAKALNYKRK